MVVDEPPRSGRTKGDELERTSGPRPTGRTLEGSAACATSNRGPGYRFLSHEATGHGPRSCREPFSARSASYAASA